MDVEITIDMISNINEYSKALLFSGDSDFLPILRYIKNKNKKIYVYSSKNNISHELRTGGSGYIDLLEVKDDIWGRILLDKKSTK